jgi:hypothetical protein
VDVEKGSGLINRKERRERKEEKEGQKEFSWNLRGSSCTSRTFSPAIPPLRLCVFALKVRKRHAEHLLLEQA